MHWSIDFLFNLYCSLDCISAMWIWKIVKFMCLTDFNFCCYSRKKTSVVPCSGFRNYRILHRIKIHVLDDGR
jgi:hypothetical protein